MIVRRRKFCSHIKTTKELKMDFLVALLWISTGKEEEGDFSHLYIHTWRRISYNREKREPAAAVLLISKRFFFFLSLPSFIPHCTIVGQTIAVQTIVS
jgi:hypothetical protein